MSKSAFLLQTAGGAVLPRVDVWIALKSNNTGTTYKSAARTTTDGLYFHPAPGDTYTVYYSLPGLSVAPASTPPSVDWFATGDTAFSVPYVAGDEIAAKDVTTQVIGPYAPLLADGVTATPPAVTYGKVWDYGGYVYHVKGGGAKGDTQIVSDGVMNGSTAVLTSASNKFVAGDVGKSIAVPGAAAAGAVLNSTILSFQSAGQVTLAANSATAVASANVVWGTKDTAKVQGVLTTACAATGGFLPGEGSIVFFGQGAYFIDAQLSITAYVTLLGGTYEGSALVISIPGGGIAINWVNSAATRFGFGVRDLAFYGQGAADGQTLFKITQGQGMVFDRCNFGAAGGTGGIAKVFADDAVNFLTNCSFWFFQHCFFSNCASIFVNQFAQGSSENILFHHCSFSANTNVGGAAITGINLQNAAYDIHFYQCSFDSVRLQMSAGTITSIGNHYEDPNSQLLGVTSHINVTGGDLTSDGDFFYTRSNTFPIIQVSAGRVSVLGRWTVGVVSGTLPNLVTISGSASVFVDMTPSGAYPNMTAIFSGTSTGVCGVNPLPDTLSPDRGDANVTVIPGADYQTQLFNTVLTANRTVTLNTALGAWGAKFRVVRGTAATGAFSLTVGPATLAVPGTWVDVVLQQTGAWLEVARGNVGTNVFSSGNVQANTRFMDASVGLTWSTTPALDASLGDHFVLVATSNIAAVIQTPTNPPAAGYSQVITVEIFNNSGGALATAPTFAAGGFLFSAVANPANGTGVIYTFRWSSTRNRWVEVDTHLAAGI